MSVCPYRAAMCSAVMSLSSVWLASALQGEVSEFRFSAPAGSDLGDAETLHLFIEPLAGHTEFACRGGAAAAVGFQRAANQPGFDARERGVQGLSRVRSLGDRAVLDGQVDLDEILVAAQQDSAA